MDCEVLNCNRISHRAMVGVFVCDYHQNLLKEDYPLLTRDGVLKLDLDHKPILIKT